jgi:hypothetical protein
VPRTDKKVNEYPQLQFLANTDELAEKFKKLGGGRRWVRAWVRAWDWRGAGSLALHVLCLEAAYTSRLRPHTLVA